MSPKEFTVRLVKAKPEINILKPQIKSRPKKAFPFAKSINIVLGSGIGMAVGVIIFLMLKHFGASFGSFESSLIIGLPSVLGIVTSLVIF